MNHEPMNTEPTLSLSHPSSHLLSFALSLSPLSISVPHSPSLLFVFIAFSLFLTSREHRLCSALGWSRVASGQVLREAR